MRNAVADLQVLLRNGRDCTSRKDSYQVARRKDSVTTLGAVHFGWPDRSALIASREPPLAGNELSATSH
jgi:hypothetical protein